MGLCRNPRPIHSGSLDVLTVIADRVTPAVGQSGSTAEVKQLSNAIGCVTFALTKEQRGVADKILMKREEVDNLPYPPW